MVDMGTGKILRDIDYPEDCKVDICCGCDACGYVSICLSKSSCKYQKIVSGTEQGVVKICMK